MVNKLIVTLTVALLVTECAAATEEYDAQFDNNHRRYPKALNTPNKFYFGRILTLDSKGRIISQVSGVGQVTKDTKVAMGVFDKKRKKWVPGQAIEGGVKADILTENGNVLRLRVTVADDRNTITQILVTDSNWKVAPAPAEFHAIYKGRGKPFSGTTPVSFVRIELDEKGRVVNYLGEATSGVTQNTKVAMGKYNKKEETWEAGEEISGGVYGALFKDPGAKTIYVHVTPRADGRGIAQILITQIGDQDKKQRKK